MVAPVGNKFWEIRSSHGRKPKFETPDVLWDAACEYFEWVHDNPLEEIKPFKLKDSSNLDHVSKETLPKMRAMTITGLCLFLDVTQETFNNYAKRPKEDPLAEDFLSIVKKIKNVIYEQKFSGAAADLLNPNIIARELGLSDTRKLQGDPENPLEIMTSELTPTQRAARIAALLERGRERRADELDNDGCADMDAVTRASDTSSDD